MKPQETWSFSDALRRVDVLRICEEAVEALDFETHPVIRVTVDELDAPLTIVPMALWNGFFTHSEAHALARVLLGDPKALCEGSKFNRTHAEPTLTVTEVTGDAQYVVLNGDFVREFTDRVTVHVEVF
jgi:hypothetical protein